MKMTVERELEKLENDLRTMQWNKPHFDSPEEYRNFWDRYHRIEKNIEQLKIKLIR